MPGRQVGGGFNPQDEIFGKLVDLDRELWFATCELFDLGGATGGVGEEITARKSRRVGGSRRCGRGPPTKWIGVIWQRGWIDQHQAGAASVGSRRPRGTVIIDKLLDWNPGTKRELHPLSAIVEFAAPLADDRHAGTIAPLEGAPVANDQDIPAGRDTAAEIDIDSLGKAHVAQVKRPAGRRCGLR